LGTDHERLIREIQRLERELETPISPDRRRAVQDALHHNRQKLVDLRRPKGLV